ncbi:MAG: PEP-CTERM sorting domain-containing protein [Planctomycetes bacterium]|nr:PEP-CTERM sorting domain-containing protein [Planctomycetota bacterium]
MLAGMLGRRTVCALVLGLSLLILALSPAAADVILLDHQASVSVSLYADDEAGDPVSDLFSEALMTPGEVFSVLSPGGVDGPMQVTSAGGQATAAGVAVQMSQLMPTATQYVYASFSFVAAGASAEAGAVANAIAVSETLLVFFSDTPFLIDVSGQLEGTELAYLGVLDLGGAEPAWVVYTDVVGPGVFNTELPAGTYAVSAKVMAQAHVNVPGADDDAPGSAAYTFSATVTPVPEPAVTGLLVAGGLWLRRRR